MPPSSLTDSPQPTDSFSHSNVSHLDTNIREIFLHPILHSTNILIRLMDFTLYDVKIKVDFNCKLVTLQITNNYSGGSSVFSRVFFLMSYCVVGLFL